MWPCSSNRPPSEKSVFASSYLALRAIEAFGRESHETNVAAAKEKAAKWFADAESKDTEDRVFRLLSLPYVEFDEQSEKRTTELIWQQRPDGGWAQLPDMDSDAYATATVLYALAEGGMEPTDAVYHRGLEYLLKQQLADGSWHVESRSKPFQLYFETGYPHGKDQFISTTAACWASLVLMHALPENARADRNAGRHSTHRVAGVRSFGAVDDGASKFVESRIKAANGKRRELKFDDQKRSALRTELQTILGVVENRLPPRLERFGDEINPALIAESETVRVFQVRWPVFANVFGEGLFVQQKEKAVGLCVVVPDADQSPEQLLGLAEGLKPNEQVAARLAANGLDLLIPTIINREKFGTMRRSHKPRRPDRSRVDLSAGLPHGSARDRL